jgi:ABC-type branched-subunit amino acid transport system ATPase component
VNTVEKKIGLANMAYVLEMSTIALKGEAKVISKDEYVIKAYLGC